MTLRSALVAVAVVVPVVTVGCADGHDEGKERPVKVIAKVGPTAITKSQFDHWARVAGHGQDLSIADGSRTQRRSSVRAEVMQFLIQARWVELEARALGVAASQSDVLSEFREQKTAAFSSERKYKRFLKQSGMRRADSLYRVRLDLLQQKMTDAAPRSIRVTDADIAAEYRRLYQRKFDKPPPRGASVPTNIRDDVREVLALDRFIDGFRRKYQRRTTCTRGYFIPECGSEASLGLAQR